MYTRELGAIDWDSVVKTVGKVGSALKDVKAAGEKAKTDVAKQISADVTPKVATATVLAAVLGSAVMLGLALTFMKRK